MFLVLAWFLLAPAASAAVEVKLTWRQEPYRTPPGLAPRLVARDDSSCPVSGYNQCGSQVPDNLCCSTDTNCMIIASNTTIICCPKGSSCDAIKPIVCEVAYQDTLKFPKSSIQTLALNATMETCGSACCPFGYLCQDDSKCILDTNQDDYDFLMSETKSTPVKSESISASASTSTSAPTPTSTSTSTSTSALASETSDDVPNYIIPDQSSITSTAATESSTSDGDSSDSGDDDKGSNIPPGVVAASTVGGVCCLSALGIFIWLKWFRRKRSVTDNPYNTSSEESWGYYSTPGSTRRVYLSRGPDDKFVVTPSTAGFSPPPIPQAPGFREDSDPVELPATPVSMCMWMNLEDASVEEPKLAYVVVAKSPGRR
ncbi:hypothetical protein G7Z17_g5441 [Cylindrodendrum hubeiense]|uniref:Uncharacterized protein n=1 Tax=Cylindrodendrum hubeiense TaxID=595255 RepID=A0A9P5LHU9_9HYPO|nr:hypothetical protein G7Z17_g5441 [Cylindrodendrum hubeiense]